MISSVGTLLQGCTLLKGWNTLRQADYMLMSVDCNNRPYLHSHQDVSKLFEHKSTDNITRTQLYILIYRFYCFSNNICITFDLLITCITQTQFNEIPVYHNQYYKKKIHIKCKICLIKTHYFSNSLSFHHALMHLSLMAQI